MGKLVKFPGNPRPVKVVHVEPCTIIVLPVIRVERYSPAELAAKLRRLRRVRLKRKGLGK